MSGADQAIMLCGTEILFRSGFCAEILEVAELGATRRTIDATTGNSPNGWGEVLYSCIVRLKPFTVTLAFSPHSDWKSAIKAEKESITIRFPAADAYNPANPPSIQFDGALTDFTIRGQLEERMTATATITPTGEPVLSLGVPN